VIGSAVGGDKLTGNTAGGVLVGHGANNIITAGAGRSVVIGGYGKNVLLGGAGNDILINGRTSYDSNIAALQSILTTWQSNPYATAIAALRVGPNRLTVGSTVILFPAQPTIGPRFGRGNVLYETTLLGNGGQNWFFTSTLSSIADRKTGEVVN
jgi:Ca2+-binding RTX toxin-like protein